MAGTCGWLALSSATIVSLRLAISARWRSAHRLMPTRLSTSKRQQPDARRPPSRAEGAAPGIAQPARAARPRGEIELPQVPQRAHGLQRVVGIGAHGHRRAEPALGLRRHGRRRAPAGALAAPARQLFAHPGAGHARATHAVGVAIGEPGLRAAAVGSVGRGEEMPAAGLLGPQRRHRAIDEGAGLLEVFQVLRQPAFVDRRHPGGAAAGGLRRQRQVHGLFVVEQLLFQHAHQRRAQLGRRCARHRDAMPADVGGSDPRHHRIGLGQQRGGRAALARHAQAVGAEQVGVLRGGIAGCGRPSDYARATGRPGSTWGREG